MRTQEVCGLKVTGFQDGCLKVEQGKTKAALRKVPVHPIVLPLVTMEPLPTREPDRNPSGVVDICKDKPPILSWFIAHYPRAMRG